MGFSLGLICSFATVQITDVQSAAKCNPNYFTLQFSSGYY